MCRSYHVQCRAHRAPAERNASPDVRHPETIAHPRSDARSGFACGATACPRKPTFVEPANRRRPSRVEVLRRNRRRAGYGAVAARPTASRQHAASEAAYRGHRDASHPFESRETKKQQPSQQQNRLALSCPQKGICSRLLKSHHLALKLGVKLAPQTLDHLPFTRHYQS
jgi:hypothetical protein